MAPFTNGKPADYAALIASADLLLHRDGFKVIGPDTKRTDAAASLDMIECVIRRDRAVLEGVSDSMNLEATVDAIEDRLGRIRVSGIAFPKPTPVRLLNLRPKPFNLPRGKFRDFLVRGPVVWDYVAVTCCAERRRRYIMFICI
jgi:hypothetical protein